MAITLEFTIQWQCPAQDLKNVYICIFVKWISLFLKSVLHEHPAHVYLHCQYMSSHCFSFFERESVIFYIMFIYFQFTSSNFFVFSRLQKQRLLNVFFHNERCIDPFYFLFLFFQEQLAHSQMLRSKQPKWQVCEISKEAFVETYSMPCYLGHILTLNA